jgi:hypothetical protein
LALATKEKAMTARANSDTACTLEPAAPGHKSMKAKILLTALVGCLGWLPLSSAAEAAPFQRYLNGVCNSLVCTIDFPVVQAGKRLDITSSSCYLRATNDRDLLAMQLLVMEDTATRSAVTLNPSLSESLVTSQETVFSTNDSIFAFANAGQRFRAYAELKKGIFKQFACHISGQLQNAN